MKEEKYPLAIKPSQLEGTLDMAIETGLSLMIWGPPGVGKSYITREVAKKKELKYSEIRALTMESVDLRGIPWRDAESGSTKWSPPEFLPRESELNGYKGFLLNLEELPSAAPSMQAAMYQLVLDKRCGEYVLPKNTVVVSCGNRSEDRSIHHAMPAALASKMIHVEVKPHVPDWLSWAVENGVHDLVISYIMFKPDMIYETKEDEEYSHPCPRTWNATSRIIEFHESKYGTVDWEALSPGQRSIRAEIAGAVGMKAYMDFSRFCKNVNSLPNIREAIENPSTYALPHGQSERVAMAHGMVSCLTSDNYKNVKEYVSRMGEEIEAMVKTRVSLVHEDIHNAMYGPNGKSRW